MKLSEAIKRVDRSRQNTAYTDVDRFKTLFNILGFFGDEFEERVKKYWLAPTYCTDTFVGWAVYYMDDEPVAVSWQSARKSDEQISFVSDDAAKKVRHYLMELQIKEEAAVIKLANLDEEFGEFYTAQHASAILPKTGVYQGKQAKIVKAFNQADRWDDLVVELEDGTQKQIKVNEFQIPLRVVAATEK